MTQNLNYAQKSEIIENYVQKSVKTCKNTQKVRKRGQKHVKIVAVYIRGVANPTKKTPAKTPFTLPKPLTKIEDFSNPALTPLTPIFRKS